LFRSCLGAVRPHCNTIHRRPTSGHNLWSTAAVCSVSQLNLIGPIVWKTRPSACVSSCLFFIPHFIAHLDNFRSDDFQAHCNGEQSVHLNVCFRGNLNLKASLKLSTTEVDVRAVFKPEIKVILYRETLVTWQVTK